MVTTEHKKGPKKSKTCIKKVKKVLSKALHMRSKLAVPSSECFYSQNSLFDNLTHYLSDFLVNSGL